MSTVTTKLDRWQLTYSSTGDESETDAQDVPLSYKLPLDVRRGGARKGGGGRGAGASTTLLVFR